MSFLTRFERWDPFDEVALPRNRMDRLWTRMAVDEPVIANWAPTADVLETKDDLVVKAELPGVDEKDIHVEIDAGMLTIRGERKAEEKIEEKGYSRIERSYGSFFRSFALPPNVETEKITAGFTNGIREVHLPKKESAKPKTINVVTKKELGKVA